MAKFRINIDQITVHDDRDPPWQDGEWRLYLDANAQRVKVDTPSGAMWDVGGGETVRFPNLFIDVSIPTTNGLIRTETLGSGCPVLSVTVPETVRFCARSCVHEMNTPSMPLVRISMRA